MSNSKEAIIERSERNRDLEAKELREKQCFNYFYSRIDPLPKDYSRIQAKEVGENKFRVNIYSKKDCDHAYTEYVEYISSSYYAVFGESGLIRCIPKLNP